VASGAEWCSAYQNWTIKYYLEHSFNEKRLAVDGETDVSSRNVSSVNEQQWLHSQTPLPSDLVKQ